MVANNRKVIGNIVAVKWILNAVCDYFKAASDYFTAANGFVLV